MDFRRATRYRISRTVLDWCDYFQDPAREAITPFGSARIKFVDRVTRHPGHTALDLCCGAGPGAYVECETVWQHGHSGPRLTDADELACARARSAIIRRVWGTDTAFLREHGDLYHRVLTEQELRAVRALLAQARTAEAREILRTIDNAPATYRVLAALPGPCVRGVMSVRRTVRSAVRGLRARPS